MASTSNIKILERFQSQVLLMAVDAPWYVPNTVIRKDLQTLTVKEESRHYTSQYSERLSVHPNDLVVNLMAQPDNRRLRRHLPNYLPIRSKFNCLICSLVFKVQFVSLFSTSYNRLSAYQLQNSATEYSSTCHCINFDAICWMYLYRLHIKWDYRKSLNRPWRPAGVFLVLYEYDLHIKKLSWPCNTPWWSIDGLRLIYEHQHITSKTIPVTGCGGMCFLWGTNIIYI
jgi:hypothetical protein